MIKLQLVNSCANLYQDGEGVGESRKCGMRFYFDTLILMAKTLSMTKSRAHADNATSSSFTHQVHISWPNNSEYI